MILYIIKCYDLMKSLAIYEFTEILNFLCLAQISEPIKPRLCAIDSNENVCFNKTLLKYVFLS